MRSSLVLSALALMVAAPAALIACSHDEDPTSSSEANVTASEPDEKGGEGTACWTTDACSEGLVCKPRPHTGPPPGAVGMPVPSSTHSHPPPGAVGMPLPPNTCQLPAPGEEGSRCRGSAECNEGLVCSFDDGASSSSSSSTGGMPPGAVGMPVPAGSTSSSSGHHFPPGAVGMPILHYGRCAKNEPSSSSSSGGPPPGALGMPIHP